MNLAELIPQYKDVQFNSKAEFDSWLAETTAYEIDFFDDGQDLQKFYVAENNEIIHADFGAMAALYNGVFVVEMPVDLGHVKIYNPKYNPVPYYIFKYTVSGVTVKTNASN